MKNIRYIVVFSTTTLPTFLPELYPHKWHYVVNRLGEIIPLVSEDIEIKNVQLDCPEAILIAYAGGKDKNGNPKDTLNYVQEESLFYKIIELSEKYKDAIVIGADLWTGDSSNPCFNVGKWLSEFEPNFEDFNSAA